LSQILFDAEARRTRDHESAENLVFAQQGGSFDYGAAHSAAIRREAAIRKELGITGGFAGGGDIRTNVPKNK
jgi:hypothetical protein